jgi:hypothetical protein
MMSLELTFRTAAAMSLICLPPFLGEPLLKAIGRTETRTPLTTRRRISGDDRTASAKLRRWSVLLVVVQKTQQLEAIAIGEFAFDPHVVSGPEISKTTSVGIPNVLRQEH